MTSQIDTTKPTAGAATTASVRQNFTYAKSEIEALQTSVSTAQTTANNAASAASTAQTTANNAASAASTAQTTANNAASAASTAQTTANNAASAASTAQTTANGAATTTAMNTATSYATITTQSNTSYTLATADATYDQHTGRTVNFTSSSPVTVTIPTNATDPIPIGSRIDCLQSGTGKVTFSGTGITINSKAGNKAIAAQHVAVTLLKTATDTWTLLGALVA